MGDPEPPGVPLRRRLRLCFGGLTVGLMFFWLSLTPSLLPRGWIAQGAVSGLSLVTGFGVGSALSATLRHWLPSEPSARTKKIAWRALAGAAVLVSVLMLWWSVGWQQELRRLVNVDTEPNATQLGVVSVTVVVAALVLVICRLVRSGTRFLIRQLDRLLPRRTSVVIGCVLAVLIVVGFAQGVLWRAMLSASSSMFSTVDGRTAEEATEPTASTRSGGPDSLVAWEDLGRQGRSFVGRGPTLADLEQLHGDACCEDPIRVYTGIRSAPTMRERAELAVADLDRAGGFDRQVLGVFTATGTGWINPNVSDALEYLYGGDTAEVSMQYSYLPSWISVLADDSLPGEATRELFGAVERHLDEMPASRRPKVFVFGESLGSFGVETGFGSAEQMLARTDGVLMIGPTYDNPVRQRLTGQRVPGSPEWQPVVDSVPDVHFAQDPSSLPPPPATGDSARVVYLQNASDPVTWWNFPLAWNKPDWAGAPAAADRSPSFRWMPLVTFWQVVGDLPVAGEVPGGHGHIFGSNVVNGWMALGTPPAWTAAKTEQLRALLDNQHG